MHLHRLIWKRAHLESDTALSFIYICAFTYYLECVHEVRCISRSFIRNVLTFSGSRSSWDFEEVRNTERATWVSFPESFTNEWSAFPLEPHLNLRSLSLHFFSSIFENARWYSDAQITNASRLKLHRFCVLIS